MRRVCDDSQGYFIRPTLIQAEDPRHRLMGEEIFGPVVTLHVYRSYEEALQLVDTASPYALTGAVFARDRQVITHTSSRLRQAAGNFYINDKPTGAVVGQQPFGGARASGTNDKAGRQPTSCAGSAADDQRKLRAADRLPLWLPHRRVRAPLKTCCGPHRPRRSSVTARWPLAPSSCRWGSSRRF